MAAVVVTAMAWADAMRCEKERKRQDQPASASASSGVGGAPRGAPLLANSAARRLGRGTQELPRSQVVPLRHIPEICSACRPTANQPLTSQPTNLFPSKLTRERLGGLVRLRLGSYTICSLLSLRSLPRHRPRISCCRTRVYGGRMLMAVYFAVCSFPGFPGGREDGSLAVRMPFASAAACCIHLVHSPTAQLQRCHGAPAAGATAGAAGSAVGHAGK